MNKRLLKIGERLIEYSQGRFQKPLPVSKKLDEVDAVCNGINMLKEELESSTVSKHYFTAIFNAVSDMVFVLDRLGCIKLVNKTAEQALLISGEKLVGKNIRAFCRRPASWLTGIKKKLESHSCTTIENGKLYLKNNRVIPVSITATAFSDLYGRPLLLFSATDTSYRMKTENLIIRAIIDTQEKERRRLAKDLHDGLTQQLSGVKFCISSVTAQIQDAGQKAVLQQSGRALAAAIAEMRNICFSLMPKTLEEFGIVKAVEEFGRQFLFAKKIKFAIKENNPVPPIEAVLQTDLYRMIQELVSNAVKHGRASAVQVLFTIKKQQLKITVKDNGCGFDTAARHEGMGLQNVLSRIKPHNGACRIVSVPGKGTRIELQVPLNSTI